MIKNFSSWLAVNEKAADGGTGAASTETSPEPTPAAAPAADTTSTSSSPSSTATPSPIDFSATPGASPTTPAPSTKPKEIKAIILSSPIESTDGKPNGLTTKTFNEYIFTEADVEKWITDNKKEADREKILNYIKGDTVKSDKKPQEFINALRDNKIKKSENRIIIEFTPSGEPLTKDINLVFLS